MSKYVQTKIKAGRIFSPTKDGNEYEYVIQSGWTMYNVLWILIQKRMGGALFIWGIS